MTSTIKANNYESVTLLNESCAFTTSYASLGKSFTLKKSALVRADVAYNNCLPTSIGLKKVDATGATSFAYAENNGKAENVAGLCASATLDAGTYYVWGSAKTAGNDMVTVYAWYL